MKQKQKEQETLQEQFPNDAVFTGGEKRPMNEDNYFENHELDVIRQKYIKFTVFMDALNDVLELGRNATVEQFAKRVYDIVVASQKEEVVS